MRALSVSVIIPAYKAARTINRAVESALGQTRPPAEVLVVDDGSPDGADLVAALARYGGRVTLLRKPNGGAASARNHGFSASQCIESARTHRARACALPLRASDTTLGLLWRSASNLIAFSLEVSTK